MSKPSLDPGRDIVLAQVREALLLALEQTWIDHRYLTEDAHCFGHLLRFDSVVCGGQGVCLVNGYVRAVWLKPHEIARALQGLPLAEPEPAPLGVYPSE